MVEAANGHTEAEWMAANVRRLQREGHDLREIAVLFRVHILSRVIEQALVRAGGSGGCPSLLCLSVL